MIPFSKKQKQKSLALKTKAQNCYTDICRSLRVSYKTIHLKFLIKITVTIKFSFKYDADGS